MARIKGELEIECPCCGATLVIDSNLGRVLSHRERASGVAPELDRAAQIVAEQAARREALFEQSFAAERGRDDALTRRFEEALKQAQQEPVSKPTRDFDLD